jgi:branched-chain amino acid transport system ATP-binding protein
VNAPVLAVEGLAAGYGKKRAIGDVSFDLAGREVLLVLGHNGAGKTTLMRAIFGLIRPFAGRVTYEGRVITARTPAENVADGIAFVPQGHGIFRTLGVQDNLELGAFVLRDKSRIGERLEAAFRLFPILNERRRQTAGTLSGGQQQMLAIGMALMHAPRVLILDEPSVGLAPNLVERVMTSVREINRSFGTAILMVEQNVRLSLPVADRAIVIKTGRKVFDGPPDALADQVELMKLF